MANRLFKSPDAYGLVMEGDSAICSQWLGYAQAQLRGVLARQKGPASLMLSPSPEVAIKIYTRPNKIVITAGAFTQYMESGVIQWQLFGCGQPLLTATPWNILIGTQNGALDGKPAIGEMDTKNIQNPPTAGGIKHQTFDAQGNVISETVSYSGEVKSIAFGDYDKRLVNELDVTDCDGNVVHISGVGLSAKNLESKKYAISKSPASIFSGVMRRYVQAMYGSTRFDMTVSKDLVYPHLTVAVANGGEAGNTITISSAYPNLFFIRRTAEFHYFFCFAVGKSITVTNMVFSYAGENCRKYLQDNHSTLSIESIKILESYALAYAKVGHGVIASVPITGENLIGNPIGFTWSSNEDGSKHTIVLHEEDSSIRMYRAREYNLDVDFISGDGGVTYSITAARSLVGTPKVWNPRDYIVWAADYTFGGNFWLSGSWPLNALSVTETDATVPLYSYYFQKSSNQTATKRVIELHDSVTTHSATDTSGSIGTGTCASYEYTNYRTDGYGYTLRTVKYPGKEGSRGIDALSGFQSRPRDEFNAGEWSSSGNYYDSTEQAAGISWNRYNPFDISYVSAIDCTGGYFYLLDGGEGSIGYTNGYFGRLVVDEPTYNAWSRPGIVDTARCWAYVPWNSANALVIGMAHNTAHGTASELLNSPCTPIATGAYMMEYLNGVFVRMSTLRTPTRHYSSQTISGVQPGVALNDFINVAAHTDYDNVIEYVIDDENHNVTIDNGAWLYNIVVPDTLFAQGQLRGLAIAGLKDNYDLGWFGTQWTHITSNFGATGIGGLGWG